MARDPTIDSRAPTRSSIRVGEIGPVAHQPVSRGELAPHIDRGHRVAGGQRDDLRALAREERIGADTNRVGAKLGKGLEPGFNLARGASLQEMQL